MPNVLKIASVCQTDGLAKEPLHSLSFGKRLINGSSNS